MGISKTEEIMGSLIFSREGSICLTLFSISRFRVAVAETHGTCPREL